MDEILASLTNEINRAKRRKSSCCNRALESKALAEKLSWRAKMHDEEGLIRNQRLNFFEAESAVIDAVKAGSPDWVAPSILSNFFPATTQLVRQRLADCATQP